MKEGFITSSFPRGKADKPQNHCKSLVVPSTGNSHVCLHSVSRPPSFCLLPHWPSKLSSRVNFLSVSFSILHSGKVFFLSYITNSIMSTFNSNQQIFTEYSDIQHLYKMYKSREYTRGIRPKMITACKCNRYKEKTEDGHLTLPWGTKELLDD